MNKQRILVIDDDPLMLDLARFHLQRSGYDVVSAENAEEGLRLIKEQPTAVALTDLFLPDVNGITLVEQLRAASPSTVIIMITGHGSVGAAVDAMKAGAFSFTEKPVDFEHLLATLEKALEHREQAEEIRTLRKRYTEVTSYYNIIGGSKAMQNVYEIIDSVAESDANVMVIGESGTGKELIANAVHFNSQRARKPFVKINCSALPKELIESELFGHTKGAFTGATTEKTGLIGQATGGSLMLDEIGEMPIELQPKLLRVLQERVYYRIGSEKALEADFRLISATNRNPLDAMRDGQLREDLFYRINTIEIRVPPLRERAEDVQHLAEHFLRLYAEKYRREVHSISEQAYEKMFQYSWPGNVRELQNVVERAVLLSKGAVIEASALPFAQFQAPAAASVAAAAASTPLANGMNPHPVSAPVHSYTPQPANPSAPAASAPVNVQDWNIEQLARLIVQKIPEIKGGKPTVDIFTQLESVLIVAALERTRGNKQAAANLLGLYRPRLYSLLRKHNLGDQIREVGSYTPTPNSFSMPG
jgi:DNA-binding NtrC family response regulator